jgi:biopolymer transport protein ExbD
MRIGSPFPYKKARIEIIPLIDIMFFLLASFMMASLSMMRLQAMRMNLPSAAAAKRNVKPEMIRMNVDQNGEVSIENQHYDYFQLQQYLSNRFQLNSNIPVYIIGSDNASHGTIIDILDRVRSIGIQKVSFAISSTNGPQR